jgi:hypothetical protein
MPPPRYWPYGDAINADAAGSPPTLTIRFYDPGPPRRDLWNYTLVEQHFGVFFIDSPDTTGPFSFVWPTGVGPRYDLEAWSYAKQNPAQFKIPQGAWQILCRRTRVWWVVSTTMRDPSSLLLQERADDILNNSKSSDPIELSIRHVAPVADAGTRRIWYIDYLDRATLPEDLVLNATGSRDADGDPLTYQWSVESVPNVGAALPWRTATFKEQVALALPKGTAIPQGCLGAYLFRLNVTDPFHSSSATVQHDLVRLNHPPAARAGASKTWRLGKGYRLQQSLVLDGGGSDPDDDPLTYQWRVVSGPGQCASSLPWANFAQASAVALASGTVIRPECVGSYNFELTVRDKPGAQNSASVTHTVEIISPTIEILATSPTVVERFTLDKGIIFDVAVDMPPEAVEPDACEVRIMDAQGARVATLPVSFSALASGVRWNGTLPSGSVLQAGIYRVEVVALTEGLVLATSNTHRLRLVDIFVELLGSSTIRSHDTSWRPLGGGAIGSGGGGGSDRAPDVPVDSGSGGTGNVTTGAGRPLNVSTVGGGGGSGSSGSTAGPLPEEVLSLAKGYTISAAGPAWPVPVCQRST